MKTRAITGFLFIIVMLASVLLGAFTFTIFFYSLSLLSLNEFYRLIKKQNLNPQCLAGVLLASSIFLPVSLHFLKSSDLSNILFCIPLITIVFLAELFSKSKNPFNNISYTFLGIIYAVIPFCFFYALGFIDGIYNYHFPLGFLLLLWTNDTGAYLIGVKFGKNKLFERHSPKKTWEGFFGGMITSLLAAFILANNFLELSVLNWCVVSLIIVIFGTLGDLTESMLKRSLDAKDSGSILPGHGGILDRFDGLLLSAPIVFVYLFWLKFLIS